tara:strand:- start:11 stop:649 length:639 start_codon:yes stop_codon:yes gene_type:complete
MWKKSEQVLESRIGLSSFLKSHPNSGSMVVHKGRRLLYMKAAKTAGTSILRKTLEPKLGGFIHKKDAPIRFDRWLRRIDDAELSRYFIFAVVRNPYDRFLSMAGYFKMSVEDLIDQYDDLVKKEPYKTHLAPQFNYTHLGNVQFADRILRFEKLSDDFSKLMTDLELPDWDLPHENRSDRSSLPLELTGQHADFVARAYRRDLELYEYEVLR